MKRFYKEREHPAGQPNVIHVKNLMARIITHGCIRCNGDLCYNLLDKEWSCILCGWTTEDDRPKPVRTIRSGKVLPDIVHIYFEPNNVAYGFSGVSPIIPNVGETVQFDERLDLYKVIDRHFVFVVDHGRSVCSVKLTVERVILGEVE